MGSLTNIIVTAYNSISLDRACFNEAGGLLGFSEI